MCIKFGLFSDLHYSLPNAETRGNSARTFDDLKQGLTRFAAEGAEFAVSLGDNTQPAGSAAEQYDQLRGMVRKWSSYGFPVHASFGNHEFSQLSLSEILEIFQTDRTYYSFVIKDIRFVILDTSYTPEGIHYSADNFDWRFGIISDDQVKWLSQLLKEKKRTFIFTHNNLHFDSDDQYRDWYMVQNHNEVCDILESSGCVEAVFQGHHHTYCYAGYRGISFVNIPSLERSPQYCESDFPVITVTEDGFLYDGRKLN